MCGGCPLIELATEHQHVLKRARVAGLFAARGVRVRELSFGPAGPHLGYRNRVRLRLDGGVPVFFNAQKHARCAVLEPSLVHALAELRTRAAPLQRLFARFAHLELRSADLDGVRSAWFVTRPGEDAVTLASGPEWRRWTEELQQAAWAVAIATADPPERVARQRFAIGHGVYARVPLGSFMQVNTRVNAELTAAVVAGARERAITRFADLFCGAGNFALALANSGVAGVGVEQDRAAIAAARVAASEQGLQCDLHAASVDAFLTTAVEQGESFDLVLADPPRAGLKQTVSELAQLAKSHVALCSCNPATLARDVEALGRAGFTLEQLRLFDMFPGTEHVECLAWLKR
jgi:23S rRNA (uracil1939-C5)-methyltransferase